MECDLALTIVPKGHQVKWATWRDSDVHASFVPARQPIEEPVTTFEVSDFPEDPLRKLVNLTVEFSPEDPGNPSTYEGTITIIGEFQIHETFEEKNRKALIRVTATSILYGACREMIANFTARSIHGILSFPSISFRKPKAENPA